MRKKWRQATLGHQLAAVAFRSCGVLSFLCWLGSAGCGSPQSTEGPVVESLPQEAVAEPTAQARERTHLLRVTGLRQEGNRIVLVTDSADAPWRSINRRSDADVDGDTGALAVLPPAGLAYVRLRCADQGGVPWLEASGVMRLDASFQDRTRLSAEPHEGACEIDVDVVSFSEQHTGDRFVFCWQPGQGLSEAGLASCGFATDPAGPIRWATVVEPVTFRRSVLTSTVKGGIRVVLPLELRAADQWKSMEIKASLSCSGTEGAQWAGRKAVALYEHPAPGDRFRASLTVEVGGGRGTPDRCTAVLSYRRDRDRPFAGGVAFCLTRQVAPAPKCTPPQGTTSLLDGVHCFPKAVFLEASTWTIVAGECSEPPP